MTRFSPADAERELASRELFGMRFGLERMRRLTTALGSPQQRFAAIHVVGTNGKSSTTRMAAAILQRHGLRAGAYLSPHLVSFTERLRVDDRDLPAERFAASVGRAAAAAALVERTLRDGERVTQFELLTAAAYDALARAGAEVVVVEAGLGGRHDATSVIDSRVAVLTNVGLDHTRWLGPTVADIAAEKLTVVPESGSLVVGPLDDQVLALAEAAAAARSATLIRAPERYDGGPLRARGAFQLRNFALAEAAAGALLGTLDAGAVREAAADVLVPGRCEVVGSEPLTIVDGAHNPAGAAALAGTLPELTGGRPLVAVISVLDDKDAAGMLRALLPCCSAIMFTANANPRSLPPATLESLARQLEGDVPPTNVEPDPRRALARARDLAGRDGAVLVTGSIFLVGDLRACAAPRAQAS